MQDFQITPEVLKNPESMAEIEGILDSALKLKRSRGHRSLNTLLTGYLQKHFDEDDPDHLDEIDEVAGFCEKINQLLQVVEMSHLK